ncbi:CLUMA_CG020450, isoform A [Clunio marinus]|uniref:CLUMA_CG020446, isoform A n=1 Tax=Clunio marinus TaxID=568069 RepID=A0A1J1J655_9DIPT|nr:CLUMA_CG020446, isoform A [Clunio marinus]CRL07482.1 CLUMA_CG020450, isoform A [Clunio marinus]
MRRNPVEFRINIQIKAFISKRTSTKFCFCVLYLLVNRIQRWNGLIAPHEFLGGCFNFISKQISSTRTAIVSDVRMERIASVKVAK